MLVLYPIVAIGGLIFLPKPFFFIFVLLFSLLAFPLFVFPGVGGIALLFTLLWVVEVIGIYLVGHSRGAARAALVWKAPLLALGVVVLLLAVVVIGLPYGPLKNFLGTVVPVVP